MNKKIVLGLVLLLFINSVYALIVAPEIEFEPSNANTIYNFETTAYLDFLNINETCIWFNGTNYNDQLLCTLNGGNIEITELGGFQIITPNGTGVNDNFFNITWTQPNSFGSADINYSINITNSTGTNVVETSLLNQLYYQWDNTGLNQDTYYVSINAKEVTTTQNVSTQSNLFIGPYEGYFYFNSSDTGNPIVGATVEVKYPNNVVDTLTTDSEGKIQYRTIINDVIQNGTYEITITDALGYITPIVIEENIQFPTRDQQNFTYSLAIANLIINIYDREDNSIFSGKDVELFMQGVFNVTTNTGQYIFNNITIVEDSYTLVAISDNYFTEQKTVTFTNQENLTLEFYMLNITGDNTGSHFVTVINEFFIEQPEAIVKLLEVDLVTNEAKEVSECLTNSNGECFFGVELGVKKYVFTGSKIIDGVLNTDTTSRDGFFINVDNDITKLFLKIRDDYIASEITDLTISIDDNILNINQGETNTTSINVSFVTESSSTAVVCVDYYTVSNNEKTLDSYECVSGASGLITSTKELNRSNDYNIQVYQVSGSLKVVYFDKNVNNINSFEQIATQEEWLSPLILVPYVLILALAFWARRIMWFWIGAIVTSWALVAWLPSIMLTSVAVIITFVCIFEMVISMKKRVET